MDNNWKKFINTYTSDQSFWYVHQSSSLNDEERILFELQILKKLENKIWNSETQSEFRNQLINQNIAENRENSKATIEDRNALSRGIKSKMTTLGLAWVNENSSIKITSVGERFLNKMNLKEITEHQLWKYIFYNPAVKKNLYKNTLIVPHACLVELLLNPTCENITYDEYKIFVCKITHINEISKTIEYIKQWRNLSEKERKDVIYKLKNAKTSSRGNSLFNKINTNLSYQLSFYTNCSYIDRDENTRIIKLKKNLIDNVKNKLQNFKNNLVEINFENIEDWIDFYGDFDKGFDELEALEYFEKKAISSNKKDYKQKAIELFNKNPKLRRSLSADDYKISLDAEIKMHKYYRDNLDEISTNLKLFKDKKSGKDGFEYYIPTIGEIDLLCTEENNFVVIEFKKNKGSDKVIGQTLRYIGWIKKNFCQNNQKVRGIIICRKYEAKIKYAADAVGPAILQYLETKFDTKLSPAKITSS